MILYVSRTCVLHFCVALSELLERTCGGCGLVRPVEDFGIKNRTTGQRRSQCRRCCSLRSRLHYDANRAAYLSRNRRNNPRQRQRAAAFVHAFLLEHACVACGEADPVVLEFNHLDPQSKVANISDMIRRGCSAGRLHDEIAKCEVACANCHQRLTSLGRAYHYKWQSSAGVSSVKSFRIAANARNHQLVLEHLASTACVDCGEPDLLVLQFDHIEAKSNHVSWLVGSGCSPNRIRRELAKCEVRCANCHRRRTAQINGWFRTRPTQADADLD
jgi:hypothetical protein